MMRGQPFSSAPPSLALDALSVPGGNALSPSVPLLNLEGYYIAAVSVGGPKGPPFTRPAGEVLAQVTLGDGQGNTVAILHQSYPGVGRGVQTSYPGITIETGYFLFLSVWQTGDGVAANVQAHVVIKPQPSPGNGTVINESVGTVPGKKVNVALGDPAAGANFATLTIPSKTVMNIRTFDGSLVVAGATTAILVISYDDGTTVFIAVSPPPSSGGAGTHRFDGGEDLQVFPAVATTGTPGRANMFPLPKYALFPGYRVSFVTVGLAGGDNWGPGILGVEEWAASQ